MRRRILQSTLLVVAITALVLGGPLAITTWQLVEDFDRSALTQRLDQLAASLPPNEPITDEGNPGLGLAAPPDGRLLIQQPGLPDLVYGVADVGDRPVEEEFPFGAGGRLVMQEPVQVLRGQQITITLVVVLLIVLSVGTGTVVATLTARRLAEPLSDVADRAARLGAGDFRTAPGRHGIPELDRVSDVLDTSAVALAELLQRERNLIGDVSHQLRSRLTALQLRLDELTTHPDPTARTEALAALEQAEKLSAVLDELLQAARAARAAGAEPLDLREGLEPIADEWRHNLRAVGRSLKFKVPEGLHARVTPARIRESVGALLDNALNHGGGTVTLAVRGSESSLLIEVSDTGDGVPEELVPHVFERGVSVGRSTGIGLALARALVEADGGRLELSRARPPTFTIFLPAARAKDLVIPQRRASGPR